MTDLSRRLHASAFAPGCLDRRRVGDALRRHARALGLPGRPIEWMDEAELAWWNAAADFGDGDWERREELAWRAAGGRFQLGLPFEPPRLLENVASALHEAWGPRDRAVYDALLARTANPYLGPVPEPRSAGACAALAGLPDGAAWMPLVDAFEAGLWIFWILRGRWIAVPRPEVEMTGGRLRVVRWPDGLEEWYWKGVRVPRGVVENPSLISRRDIDLEENVEVRRVLIERFGAERYLRELQADPLQADDCGRLYRVDLPGDEPLVLVRVVNATPEPDGSRREYFLRVPPGTSTAREAVAWTFRLGAADYHPVAES